MMKLLAALFGFSQKGFVKNALAGAGLMLVSSAAIMTAFNVAYQAMMTSFSAASGNVLALAHVAGIDTALTIILSAIVTRLGLNSFKLSLKKASH